MSTITTQTGCTKMADRATALAVDEQRIVIRDVGWNVYDILCDAIGERQKVFVAYDGSDLEIMTKGWTHESFRENLGKFVSALTYELRIRCRSLGETTWKRPAIERGLESDLCYYFTPDKIAADVQGLARKSNDIADYPNPDLAIEVDVSPSLIDRPAIYAALQVTEVWRFKEESLLIEQLCADGNYVRVESSRFLPVRADEVYRWVAVEDSSDELLWEQQLREWARLELQARS
jgi:Uma2 family endonuclease